MKIAPDNSTALTTGNATKTTITSSADMMAGTAASVVVQPIACSPVAFGVSTVPILVCFETPMVAKPTPLSLPAQMIILKRGS